MCRHRSTYRCVTLGGFEQHIWKFKYIVLITALSDVIYDY
jgi:hypothetical protein